MDYASPMKTIYTVFVQFSYNTIQFMYSFHIYFWKNGHTVFFNWAKRAVSIQNIYIQFFQCRKHAVFVLHIRIENVWRAVFIQIKKLDVQITCNFCAYIWHIKWFASHSKMGFIPKKLIKHIFDPIDIKILYIFFKPHYTFFCHF